MENEHITEYERTPFVNAVAEHRLKGEEDFGQYQFLFEGYGEAKNLMNIGIPVTSFGKNDILLPLFLEGKYPLGSCMQIKMDDDIYDMNVVGYIEDPYFSSSINITVYSVVVSQEMMDTFTEDHPTVAIKGYIHKGRMADLSFETEKLESEIAAVYKASLEESKAGDAGVIIPEPLLVNWQLMRGGAQFMPMVFMAVILIFAFIVLVISLVVISFSIRNFITRSMKNTGILEACGYTVTELRLSLSLQILLVTLIGSAAGILTAVATFRYFAVVITMILGLKWTLGANLGIGICVLCALLLISALLSVSLSSALRKIPVLDALRGGISTHNFRKNFFSFEKTPLPIPVVLSLKDCFGNAGRNILIVFISAILMIAALAGFGIMENFGKDTIMLLRFMGMDMATIRVDGDDGYTEDIAALDGVRKVVKCTDFEPVISFGDDSISLHVNVADDVHNVENLNMIEGRVIENDNEIMLTNGVMEDLGVKVGDVVTLEYAGTTADYLVCGSHQRIDRMGRSAYMTFEGASRIHSGDFPVYYYVNASDGVTYEQIESEVKTLAEDKDLTFTYQNLDKMMKDTAGTLTLAMKLLCIIITGITVFIVVFVESLVIRAKMAREWKDLGISNAIGRSSRELIVQIMLSNIP
ncbi:MAG: ABC transporter permease, partial [Lachnospiraceae bacterium]|nr:ABC transporter permease [Lachnospiraceae bacterium]